MSEAESRYLELLLAPLDKCAEYKPKFGSDRSNSVSLDGFRRLYGDDPFYHWVGLDSDLMYAAHKAAGGMTSIYRQLGTGCERLLRAVIQDALGLTRQQVVWSYEIEKKDATKGTLTLDARIDVEHLADGEAKSRVTGWLLRAGRHLEIKEPRLGQLRGAVLEVRQGYKSADAKRSNADLGFGMNAASDNYLPVLAVVSTQASGAVLRRYRNNKLLVLTGTISDDDTVSTYAFLKRVIGFDLDEFFKRNSTAMRERCARVLQALLSVKPTPDSPPATAVSVTKKRRSS